MRDALDMRRGFGRQAHDVALVLAGSAALALWSTWPLPRYATTHLPLGAEPYATVPLFNVWTIWWNADRLAHGFARYWDAPIFFPESGTFAFSEPQPATLVVSPVLWLSGSRILVYNVYLWLALTLNGAFAWRLLRVLGCGRWSALAGGAAMVLLPVVHWQREVLQLAPVWPIVWTWTALLQLVRRPTRWSGVELGAGFVWTCMTCLHQGVLLAVLLAGAGVTLWRHRRRARLWLALVCAAVVAALGTAPLLLPMQARLDEHQFARPRGLVEQLSARPGDYTVAPGKPLVDIQSNFARPHWWLSPGWVKWGLAFAGGLWGLSRRRWRWWSSFLLLTAVLAFLLSLGPHLKLGSWTPYWTLADCVPGLDRVRNVFRFAFFVQMAVVLLAAQAIHAGEAYARVWKRRASSRALRRAVIPLFALGVAFEVLPAEVTLGKAPDATAYRGWIAYVREHASPGRAVACLPMAQGNDAGDFDLTTRWMYLATFHGAPLVNGYSGFFPQSDFNLRDVVNASFPSEESLEWLELSGTELVVVLRSPDGVGPVPAGQYGRYRLELKYSDSAGVDVYRLAR